MKFLYPVPPNSIVTQTFQGHVNRAKAHGWKFYNGGIDWAVMTGTRLKAAQAGKVIATRHDATGYGSHVRIEHDGGYMTIYGHMLDFAVSEGDKVKAGDVIGRSDNTGNSTGPHLHFELRRNNTAIDPQPLLVKKLPTEAEEEPEVEEPEVEEPVEEPSEFPKLPQVKVTADGLNIRRGPGTDNPKVGLLQNGEVVGVIEKTEIGDNIWLRIGHEQFIAMYYNGEYLAVWK